MLRRIGSWWIGFFRDLVWALGLTLRWIITAIYWIVATPWMHPRPKRCQRCGYEFFGEYCRFCWEKYMLRQMDLMRLRRRWRERVRKRGSS
jgi:hypothetical protein